MDINCSALFYQPVQYFLTVYEKILKFLIIYFDIFHGFKNFSMWLPPFFFVAVVGTNTYKKDGIIHYIIDQIAYPNYTLVHKFTNDIGLLRTENRIIFKAAIRPIPLPRVEPLSFTTLPTMVLAGWGYTSVSSSIQSRTTVEKHAIHFKLNALKIWQRCSFPNLFKWLNKDTYTEPETLQFLYTTLMDYNVCKSFYDLMPNEMCSFNSSGHGGCYVRGIVFNLSS